MPIRVSAIVALAVMLLVPWSAPAAGGVRAEERNTLTVTGAASASHPPDTATVVVAVETTAKTAPEAMKANSRRAEAVVNAVKGLIKKETGDSVKTSHFSVQPVYDYNEAQRKNVFVGYRAVNQITVRTKDITLAGALIDSASKSGADRVDSVAFSIENVEQHCKDILARAVEKAKREAALVARALEVPLTGVGSAASSCGVQGGIQPFFRREPAAAKQAVADTGVPIETGDIEVRGEVTVSFLLGR